MPRYKKEGETMKVVPLNESAFEKGIDLFNQGKYFNAHEAWRGLWFRARKAQEKLFLQGLIAAAGALLHTQKRECAGAAKLLAKSIPLLRNGVETHPDLQLNDFIEALERLGGREDWCLAAGEVQYFPKIGRSDHSCEPHAAGVAG